MTEKTETCTPIVCERIERGRLILPQLYRKRLDFSKSGVSDAQFRIPIGAARKDMLKQARAVTPAFL